MKNKIKNEKQILKNIPDQELEAILVFYENSIFYVRYEGIDVKQPIEISGEELEQAFAGISFNSGLLDLNTLFFAKTGKVEEILLFFPKGTKKIVLKSLKKKNKVITIPVPAHVFHGIGQSYKIFAVKDLQEGTLYQMPVPNVHPNGAICHGSVKFPECSKYGIKQAYNLFWESAFNKDLSDGKLVDEKLNLHKFLQSLNGENEFPVDMLVEMDINIKNLIKNLEKNND